MSAVIGNRHTASANRAKAVRVGPFTEAMRSAFGSIVIEYVNDSITLGKPPVFAGTFVSTRDMPSLDLTAAPTGRER